MYWSRYPCRIHLIDLKNLMSVLDSHGTASINHIVFKLQSWRDKDPCHFDTFALVWRDRASSSKLHSLLNSTTDFSSLIFLIDNFSCQATILAREKKMELRNKKILLINIIFIYVISLSFNFNSVIIFHELIQVLINTVLSKPISVTATEILYTKIYFSFFNYSSSQLHWLDKFFESIYIQLKYLFDTLIEKVYLDLYSVE